MSYTASDLKLVKDHQNTTQSLTVIQLMMSYTASDLKLVKDHQNTTQSFTVRELESKWSQTSKRPPEHYTEFDS